MRIVRFAKGDELAFGVVDGEDHVTEIDGHPFQPSFELSGTRLPLADVRPVAPILPTKILAIGRNYAEHAAELGNEVPDEPLVFIKPSTSVVGPGEPVVYPAASAEVHHEAELAVVIGRVCRQVPRERVPEVVFGYTCGNDVTARDLQRREPQWARPKGFDTFCPLGPWIETEVDASDLAITCTVDDELRQSSRTSLMINDVAALVSYITEAMTLLPGDVILTGTPAGVGPLLPGQRVSVTIEGIGTLTNPVVAAD
ncbi:MAG: fumarylacetoacetate hydrolase family protein [Acidothermales bacterium]|nr:fumarylacetoacetate hydrolase family protein [Acidothermales bacterium]